MPAEWAKVLSESAKISQLCLPVIVPVTEFRDVMGVGLTNLIGGADPATEMKRATEEFRPVLAKSESCRSKYNPMTITAPTMTSEQQNAGTKAGKSRLKPSYWPFVIPALVIVGAVIIFPWVFTLWMSVNEWHLGGEKSFVGLANFVRLGRRSAFLGIDEPHSALYGSFRRRPAVSRHDRRTRL